MTDSVSFLTLFLLGFFGGGHCVGMCGGLSSAFALQLPPYIGRFRLIVLLNLGRISSYTVIGLLAGALGQFGISLDQTRTLQTVLFTAAHVLLLLLGLYLAGLSDWANPSGGGSTRCSTACCRLKAYRPASASACCGAGCPAAWFTVHRSTRWAAVAHGRAG